MNMQSFTKQGLKRWELLPQEERNKLLAKLKRQEPGIAVIELDEPTRIGNALRSQGRVVSIVFGMELGIESKKRYLFLVDLEAPPEKEHV